MPDLSQIMPPQHANDHNTAMWIDEQIWGIVYGMVKAPG